MNSDEIKQAVQTHLGDKSGYNEAAVQQFSDGLAGAMIVAASSGQRQPSEARHKHCYDKCTATRDAAFADAAAKPGPLRLLAIAAAVTAFNMCRVQCDQDS